MKLIALKALQVISVLILGTASLGLVIVGLAIQSGVFQEKVESNAIAILTKSLGKQVSIGKVKGNLLTNIQFEDIEIIINKEKNDSIKIKNIKATYSLKGIQKIHKKWVPTLKRIDINDISLNVIRYNKTDWNVFSLINKETNRQKTSLKLPFSGPIKLSNIHGNYSPSRSNLI